MTKGLVMSDPRVTIEVRQHRTDRRTTRLTYYGVPRVGDEIQTSSLCLVRRVRWVPSSGEQGEDAAIVWVDYIEETKA